MARVDHQRPHDVGVEVPAERDTAAASSRREDAGLRVLGRLLWVALVAGALIGGLTAQSPDAPTPLLVCVVPTLLTAVTAWAAAPWCLAPILPRPDHGKPPEWC